MSLKVLVIPEDFRKDQYMLKPMIDAMLTYLDKPRSKVTILKDPLLGGIDRALNEAELAKIVQRCRGMVDLFLLCVDRDGSAGRPWAWKPLSAMGSVSAKGAPRTFRPLKRG